MMSSRARILANLNSKENNANVISPSRKRSSDEAFPLSDCENASKRRTVDAFQIPRVKSKTLFVTSSKSALKKQASIKSFCRPGKENAPHRPEQKAKIFNEKKPVQSETKTKEDETFSMMCDEEAPEKYWELLAEERRKGLEIALRENKELAEEIRAKDETIKELRTEVDELKESAKHAEYLASFIEDLGEKCGVKLSPSDKEEEEESCSDSEDEGLDKRDASVCYPEKSASRQEKDKVLSNQENVTSCQESQSTSEIQEGTSLSSEDVLISQGDVESTQTPSTSSQQDNEIPSSSKAESQEESSEKLPEKQEISRVN